MTSYSITSRTSYRKAYYGVSSDRITSYNITSHMVENEMCIGNADGDPFLAISRQCVAVPEINIAVGMTIADLLEVQGAGSRLALSRVAAGTKLGDWQQSSPT